MVGRFILLHMNLEVYTLIQNQAFILLKYIKIIIKCTIYVYCFLCFFSLIFYYTKFLVRNTSHPDCFFFFEITQLNN